jgi:pimeloyl-ACP methyl ester carboxylesterase
VTRRDARRRRALRSLRLLALSLVAAATVTAGDAAPWSEVRGAGEPTVVLLHGLGATHEVWNLVAPHLESRHRVVLVDLPGHGASLPLGTVSVANVARAVDRALAARGVERAVIVGHSFGGWVALEEAVARPKRAAAVVVLDLGAYTPVDTARVSSLDRYLTERYPSLIQAIFETMSQDPVESDSAVAGALRVDPDVLRAYFRETWRTDLRPRLRGLKIPVHVVATEATWPSSLPWDAVRDHLGYATNGPVSGHRIQDSAHLIMRDQPDSLVALIERIVAESAGGKAAGAR